MKTIAFLFALALLGQTTRALDASSAFPLLGRWRVVGSSHPWEYEFLSNGRLKINERGSGASGDGHYTFEPPDAAVITWNYGDSQPTQRVRFHREGDSASVQFFALSTKPDAPVTFAKVCRVRPKKKPQNSLQFVYAVHTDNPSPTPYNDYQALRAWVAMHDFLGFPKEFRLDLNGDGNPEVFLPVMAHLHFASYSIFTRRGRHWVYVGHGDYSNPPVRLVRGRAGWHDFAVDVDGSRNSLDRRYFRYDPDDQSYDLSYSVSLRPMEHDASEPVEP